MSCRTPYRVRGGPDPASSLISGFRLEFIPHSMRGWNDDSRQAAGNWTQEVLNLQDILNRRISNKECPPAIVADRGGGSDNCINIKVMMLHSVCLNVRRTGPMLKFFLYFEILRPAPDPIRGSLFIIQYSLLRVCNSTPWPLTVFSSFPRFG